MFKCTKRFLFCKFIRHNNTKTCTSTFVPLNIRPALRNEYIVRGFPALYVCYFWNRFGVLKKYKAHNSKYV